MRTKFPKGTGRRVKLTLSPDIQERCLEELSSCFGIRETYKTLHTLYVHPIPFCQFMSLLTQRDDPPGLDEIGIAYVTLSTEPRITHVPG